MGPSDQEPAFDDTLGTFGHWGDLASAAAQLMSQAIGGPVGGAAASLAMSLFGVGDTQTRLLLSIKSDTQALRSDPFKMAIQLLRQATEVSAHDREWLGLVTRSRDSLERAVNLARGPYEKAIVELYLYVAWMLLGRPDHAGYCLKRSMESARAAIDQLAWESEVYVDDLRSGSRRRGRNTKARIKEGMAPSLIAGLWAGTFIGFPIGLALSERRQKRDRMRKIAVLQNYVTLYNTVQYLLGLMNGTFSPAYVQLTDTGQRRRRGWFQLTASS